MKTHNNYNLKTRYYIEPSGFSGWIFRREGSDNIIKRGKYKLLLISYAESYCDKQLTELMICDENGMLEDVVEIGKEINRDLRIVMPSGK